MIQPLQIIPTETSPVPQRPLLGVTAPRGFLASGVHCGLRKKRPDLALVISESLAATACVYTTNKVQAAPIIVTRENMSSNEGWARAIIINAGNANACTGTQGLRDAKLMAQSVANELNINDDEVIVSSTGVIGQALPIRTILSGVPLVTEALTHDGGASAAYAIQTTDTTLKQSVRRMTWMGRCYTIGGMAKGSGMIHPNMATTLGFITTDAGISPEDLQLCLKAATEQSFNRITVDGDTSTNDMITAMANGASGLKLPPEAIRAFQQGLTEVLIDLARQVASDGEGANRLITVRVTSAKSEAEALQVARTIASSPLVKTAVHGADANWGRIIAAAGRAGVDMDPELAEIRINDLPLLEPGYRSNFDEEEASRRLSEDEVVIRVDLGSGASEATTWTCDLTADYIRINASYRS